MGCGSSASRDVEPISHRQAEENTWQVHIEKGTNAKLRPDTNNIIFVFGEIITIGIVDVMVTITGGPGSGKGRIISEVLEEQRSRSIAIELISTELLILDQLPHKVSNAIKLHSTKDVTGE